MTVGADLIKMVDRAAAITGSYGRTQQHVDRIDAAAYAITAIKLAHQEMDGFIRFVYKRSDNGYFVHIKQDGLIHHVWTPWGCKSVLARSQRNTLRTWILSKKRPPPPFYYVSSRLRWYVDLERYETEESVLNWLKNNQITINEWLSMQMSVSNSAT